MKCSANCQSCSQPNTCDSCSSGYGFLNGECIICPSGTHILSGTFCIGKFSIKIILFKLTFYLGKCSQNCQYCSRPGSCDTCSPGFGFINGYCNICPSATHFLNNGICQGKFSVGIFLFNLPFY